MTTVGFRDITPTTGLGRLIASVMMLLGGGVRYRRAVLPFHRVIVPRMLAGIA